MNSTEDDNEERPWRQRPVHERVMAVLDAAQEERRRTAPQPASSPRSETRGDFADDFEEQLRRGRIARERLMTTLLGADDDLGRQAPPPVDDMEALLGEHAAQLRNTARYMMGEVISQGSSVQESAKAATVVNNVIRTNIAIAKALREAQPRKTVRGVATSTEPQD
jgi:hypothetical protein